MGKKTEVMCPNCGAQAVRMEKDGTVLVCCEKEDAVFAVTRTGAKLRRTGALEELDKRVSALERESGRTTTPAAGDAGVPDETTVEPAAADEDDDEDVTILDDEDEDE